MRRRLITLATLAFASHSCMASTDTLYTCMRAEVGYNRSWFAGLGASALFISESGLSTCRYRKII